VTTVPVPAAGGGRAEDGRGRCTVRQGPAGAIRPIPCRPRRAAGREAGRSSRGADGDAGTRRGGRLVLRRRTEKVGRRVRWRKRRRTECGAARALEEGRNGEFLSESRDVSKRRWMGVISLAGMESIVPTLGTTGQTTPLMKLACTD
jgi:hypothetical protein